MQRHNVAWQDSLRYRRPDLDRMSGIRRITANNNPILGDDGARLLAEALKDDLWLKALDLQACGIGPLGIQNFLDVLKYNTTLVVLDLRRNPLIERDSLHSVMEQLILNSNGEDGEYKWMKADEPEELAVKPAVRSRRRATKVLNTSMAKKATIKIAPTNARRRARGPVVTTRKIEVLPSPGLPWRTAARANRFRGHPPDTSRFLTDQSDDVSEAHNDNVAVARSKVVVGSNSSSRMKRISAEASEAMKKLEESHMSLDLTNQKEVMIEFEQMRRLLTDERLARARADQQLIPLMIENRQLTEEIALLRRSQRSAGGALEDESFLDSVETAFKQFHAFIDMLREAGLGQLVTMAGLDQTQMPIIGGNHNISNNNSAGNGRNGLSNSHFKTPGPSASFTNAALGSSPFKYDHQKPIGRATSLTADANSMTSKEAPDVIGRTTRQGQSFKARVYDEESETARQEADELYSRLVKETRDALGQDAGASSAESSFAGHGLTVGAAQVFKEDGEIRFAGHNDERDPIRLSTMDSFEDANIKQPTTRGQLKLIDAGSDNEDASLHMSERQNFRDEESSFGEDKSKDDDF